MAATTAAVAAAVAMMTKKDEMANSKSMQAAFVVRQSR